MEQLVHYIAKLDLEEKWTGLGKWGRGVYMNALEDPKKGVLMIGLIILFVVLLTLIFELFKNRRILIFELFKNRRIERNGVVLKILVKKSTSAKQTEALIRNLHSLILNTKLRSFVNGRPYVSFEIAADKERITFYAWVPKDYQDVLKERIYATYPECAIHKVNDYIPKRIWMTPMDYLNYIRSLIKKEKMKFPRNHQSIYGTEMELAFHHVLNLNKQLDREDIISSIVSAMTNLEWHEKVYLQIIARPIDGRWQQAGQKVLRDYVTDGKRPNKKGHKTNSKFIEKMAEEFEEIVDRELEDFSHYKSRKKATSARKTPYERKEISGATEKILDAGFETVIRLATVSNFRRQAKTRLKMLGAAFNELDKENKLARRLIFRKRWFYNRLKKRRVYVRDRNNILTPAELSKFYLRLPDEDVINRYPDIEALNVKEFAPPRGVEKERFIIGTNTYRGIDTPIGMKWKDVVRHVIAQGSTGTGKSEWCKTLMKQQMDLGLGFVLFEPHGKLAIETLQFVPENRRKDVIVFDLFDEYPPAFNFCKVRTEKGRKTEQLVEKTAKEIIDINKRLFSDAWSVKNAYYLENAIKTVIELNGGNYVDIRRLFRDHEFRQYAINNIHDPNLKAFWREEFKLDKNGKLSTTTQSTVNSVDYKLGSFLNTKSLLRAVGQDDCIDFRDIMDKNKILIFRFDKQRMSEDQISFIGGIALKLLTVEAFNRDKTQWENPFLIIMDEFQNFVNPNIETILDELRKYGVGLFAMHQRLAQLDKVSGLKDAIYNNVGTRVSFTCGDIDAPFFANIFKPRVDEDDMVGLPSRYAYVKLLVDGKKSDTFNIYTLDSPQVERKDAIKAYKEIMLHNREGRTHYKEIDKLIAERIVGDFNEIEEDHYEEVPDSTHVKGWDDYEEPVKEDEEGILYSPEDYEATDPAAGEEAGETAEQKSAALWPEENNKADLFNDPEYDKQENIESPVSSKEEYEDFFAFDEEYENALNEEPVKEDEEDILYSSEDYEATDPAAGEEAGETEEQKSAALWLEENNKADLFNDPEYDKQENIESPVSSKEEYEDFFAFDEEYENVLNEEPVKEEDVLYSPEDHENVNDEYTEEEKKKVVTISSIWDEYE